MQDPKILVALDFSSEDAALQVVDQLHPEQCGLKVGKEMFTYFGPGFVRQLVARKFNVFLDLKFHDIPNTVAKAVTAAAELGVWMVNVHASGGERMMVAAREALEPYGSDAPKLIAVTVLTSMAQRDLVQIGIDCAPAQQVMRLAKLTHACGLDGVVCSAQEATQLKQTLGKAFQLVTPGIRPEGSEPGDQRRVMTPAAAMAAGSDYLVMGRPVTQAKSPAAVVAAVHRSLSA